MRPRKLKLHPMTARRLLRLKREAEGDGAYRVAKRIHAVLLNHDGYTSGQITAMLKLPPYSPEFNATERLWRHARVSGTHNRYFANAGELNATLTRIFRSMQRRPDQIRGFLQPFA